MRPYLRPTTPIAADVLLPADPGLAMELAQRLTAKPLMANHHHGLWGYSGRTEDGRELTVQSAGIGGASTAAIVAELAGHGARRVVRIGECTALDPALAAGEAVTATGAMGAELGERLAGARREVAVASHDRGAEAGPSMREEWAAAGIAAVDLETAALFATAERLGLAAAALLVVVETAAGLVADEPSVREALLALGELAADAFARSTETPSTVV